MIWILIWLSLGLVGFALLAGRYSSSTFPTVFIGTFVYSLMGPFGLALSILYFIKDRKRDDEVQTT
jgi:hypothetical protein